MKIYRGYDLIYSEDDGGWYAVDFNDPRNPVSKEVYADIEDLKEAIRSGNITFE